MTADATFGLILPAAGSGTRFGGGGAAHDKLLVDVAGKSVLLRTVEAFADRSNVAAIVIVTVPARFEVYRTHLAQAEHPGVRAALGHLQFVAGGRERWESVLCGLRALTSGPHAPPRYVAIHDTARPLVTPAVIDAAFQGAIDVGGAVPCVPEPATLKRRSADGCVSETVDRRELFQAQTPQCFELARLLSGFETLERTGRLADVTDDAQVFERMGWPVKITEGAVTNMKITTPEDVAMAGAIIHAQQMR